MRQGNLKAGMIGCGQLTSLVGGVLATFQNLETLHVYRSGLTAVPDMSQFRTLNSDMNSIMREIDFHNNMIGRIRTHDFFGIKTDLLNLEENQITSVDRHAFKNATIVSLSLSKNTDLRQIADNAFDGVDLLDILDLSFTSISSLPTKGLNVLRHLILKNTPSLKHFPSVLEFRQIEQAELTYPHHCCAFRNPEKQNPSAWRAKYAQELINAACSLSTSPLPTQPIMVVTPISTRLPKSLTLPETHVEDGADYDDTLTGDAVITKRLKRQAFGRFGNIQIANDTDSNVNEGYHPSASIFGKFILSGKIHSKHEASGMQTAVFHKSTVSVDENSTQRAECGEIYIYNRNIACTPEPDAFNPCEDVMGYVWLRVTVWFVLLAALLGNSVVLIVLTTSRGKFTVPKFLMCNLAFADFIMGVYLILLASIDIRTLGEYFNHAVRWQNEGGCQTAGFLSVFSSELSVFTLTILTLERWYAISHAIHLNKRLKLRQSFALMVLGYTFAAVLALLPLIGISSYGNVSICLPMRAESGVDIGYVVSLLIMNGVMFLAICFCYVSMYWQVKGSATTARSNDATIAKRMALLVFTNFACWAPIAFFGLTASAGVPLIDITNSKILLVFFYPLNSCANPFLYAILTKQFRKDVFILLGKCGICVERANMYRGTFTSRTLSNSRGHKGLALAIHRSQRQTESVLTHIDGSNHSSKHSMNSTPKVHPAHHESAEAQPFIEHRSHLDRAAEFANKEPVLAGDEVTLDTWDTNDCQDILKPIHPKYIRSVSDYATQLNARKLSTGKGCQRKRTSVDTYFSSSTDTTNISDNSHSLDEIWQVRKECTEGQTLVQDRDCERAVTGVNHTPCTCTVCHLDDNNQTPHHNCYTVSADFEESDVYQRLVHATIIQRKEECSNISKLSIKPVNNLTNEVRPRYYLSPSLSSLDESTETCLVSQWNGIATDEECNNCSHVDSGSG